MPRMLSGRKDTYDARLFPPIGRHLVCRLSSSGPNSGTLPKARRRATHAAHCRAASGRRRFVDPTTCERDYSAAELEFMQAMQEYKQISGRPFPAWTEVLEVVRGLGYQKQS